jgi:hypothetical protein
MGTPKGVRSVQRAILSADCEWDTLGCPHFLANQNQSDTMRLARNANT